MTLSEMDWPFYPMISSPNGNGLAQFVKKKNENCSGFPMPTGTTGLITEHDGGSFSLSDSIRKYQVFLQNIMLCFLSLNLL